MTKRDFYMNNSIITGQWANSSIRRNSQLPFAANLNNVIRNYANSIVRCILSDSNGHLNLSGGLFYPVELRMRRNGGRDGTRTRMLLGHDFKDRCVYQFHQAPYSANSTLKSHSQFPKHPMISEAAWKAQKVKIAQAM